MTAPTAVRYNGSTSQHQPLLIVLAPTGTTITAVITAVAYDHQCKSAAGSSIYYVKIERSIPVRRHGFDVQTTARRPPNKQIPVAISGRFVNHGHRVIGTIAATGAWAHCPPPRTADNPFHATFNAPASSAAGP